MGLLRTQIRMEKKKTRARLENRRRKWVTRNMFSTSSWIPIMILKKGKFGENIRRGAAVGRPAGYWPRILQQWPRQRLGLDCTDTLVCFANNKQWDFYFFPNKM